MASADLAIPDTVTSRAARELSQSASPRFLFEHTVRTYVWACSFAAIDGIEFDPELLYVGALLHDLGLTARFDGPRCFENEGAAAAASFVLERGWEPLRAERLAEAIRLHMHPRVVPEDGNEGYLLSEATSCDVRGHRFDEIDRDLATSVVAEHPWLDFGPRFVELFREQAARKPGCLADLYLQRGWEDRVIGAPHRGG
jgi:HD superfamily phosphodiesterase